MRPFNQLEVMREITRVECIPDADGRLGPPVEEFIVYLAEDMRSEFDRVFLPLGDWKGDAPTDVFSLSPRSFTVTPKTAPLPSGEWRIERGQAMTTDWTEPDETFTAVKKRNPDWSFYGDNDGSWLIYELTLAHRYIGDLGEWIKYRAWRSRKNE